MGHCNGSWTQTPSEPSNVPCCIHAGQPSWSLQWMGQDCPGVLLLALSHPHKGLHMQLPQTFFHRWGN
jgi:hypothetical protein